MTLDRILRQTREDVARRRRTASDPGGLAPSERSLAAALGRPHTGFILECKRASPSEGVIRADYDPAAIATACAPFADALSVLTDGPFFQGSPDHLRAARAAAPVPVLCKDFVVDPWQVAEARAWGADAVLLMLSVLDDAGWEACARRAGEVGIETLTEVHDEAELARALRLGAPVIGINNRDLRTLAVDRDVVRRLAPRVPRDRLVVCESGIRHHGDARALRPLVDAFLVGTSLMRAPDLAAAVRRLVFGVTKVCGLTRPEDAAAAWAAGATHGGLIFAPESPRRVDLARARAVAEAAPLAWVGVFVNADPARVAASATALGLAAVQLHGEESPDYVAALRPLLPAGCEVWKAARVRDRVPPLAATGADRLLLDAWRRDRRGGTGERFDWALLDGHADRDRLILSGGLTPEQAAAADELDLFALDVNSGVEQAPGLKSPDLLAAFLAARRGQGRERAT
jgi:indole-3-glycerol phosphate synthase/phosphoribosylanthranilate isomerase